MQKPLSLGRALAALAVVAVVVPSSPSSAQSFSAFLPVSAQGGFLLKFNDAVVTNLGDLGGAGKYTTGYSASGTPIVLKFATSDGSGFGGVSAGDTLTVTRIGAVYLLDADGITANRDGNTLFAQDGTTTEAFNWVPNTTSGGSAGTGYSDDANGFFADAKKFLADSNAEGSGGDKPLFGDFLFSSVSAGGSANPTLLAFDLGGFVNGTGRFVTGHVRLEDLGVPPTGGQVPEPGTLSLLAAAAVPALALYRRRWTNR